MRDRIKKLRECLGAAGLDSFYVTSPENRYYLSGFSGSAGALYIDLESSFLLTDFRYIEQAARESPDFEIIRVDDSYPGAVLDLAKQREQKIIGCESDHLSYIQYLNLKDTLGEIELRALSGLIENLRVCKYDTELECIEEAVRLADNAFSQVLPSVKPGVTERDIAIELDFVMRKMGAEGPAFKIIVASGPRSALPHGVASGRAIQAGDLVTFDFGAVYRGYHSDMTRTVVIGQSGVKQKLIYSIVLEAQMKALATIRAGVKASEVDRAARSVIEDRGYGVYFGHSTGHGLGLNIHEKPRLSSRDHTVLSAGMVVTVEPGIYVPEWGGVRIEDTVVVENNGCRVLTRTPKDILQVLS